METPKTKAQEYDIAFKTWKHDIKYTVVDADFARELETELKQLNSQLTMIRETLIYFDPDPDAYSWENECETIARLIGNSKEEEPK